MCRNSHFKVTSDIQDSFVWSSATFTSLAQDGRINFPDIPIATKNESWALYYSAAQYLWQDPCDDKRGWGLFVEAGISDGRLHVTLSHLAVVAWERPWTRLEQSAAERNGPSAFLSATIAFAVAWLTP